MRNEVKKIQKEKLASEREIYDQRVEIKRLIEFIKHEEIVISKGKRLQTLEVAEGSSVRLDVKDVDLPSIILVFETGGIKIRKPCTINRKKEQKIIGLIKTWTKPMSVR